MWGNPELNVLNGLKDILPCHDIRVNIPEVQSCDYITYREATVNFEDEQDSKRFKIFFDTRERDHDLLDSPVNGSRGEFVEDITIGPENPVCAEKKANDPLFVRKFIKNMVLLNRNFGPYQDPIPNGLATEVDMIREMNQSFDEYQPEIITLNKDLLSKASSKTSCTYIVFTKKPRDWSDLGKLFQFSILLA